jgi:hypothetical protein
MFRMDYVAPDGRVGTSFACDARAGALVVFGVQSTERASGAPVAVL